MIFHPQNIAGVKLIELNPYVDQRGSLTRFFCQQQLLNKQISFDVKQCNLSVNKERLTLRGFHYQKEPFSEQKILSCIRGKIYNVVVDLRRNSNTYLQHQAFNLDATAANCLYLPVGCANAFLTLEKDSHIFYWHSAFFNPDTYAGFRYDDPYFDIIWPDRPAIISDRDLGYPDFHIDELQV